MILDEEKERVLEAMAEVDAAERAYDDDGRRRAAEDAYVEALLDYYRASEASMGRDPYAMRGAA